MNVEKKDVGTRKNPVVLVIDSNVGLQTEACNSLGQVGFDVLCVKGGYEALAIMEDCIPQLIVLDTELPDITGFELCALIQSKEHLSDIPILMLTATSDTENINQAYKSGAADFTNKPVNWSLCVHRLQHLHSTRIITEKLERERQDLAVAQRIARLGSWQLDLSTGDMEWSSQLYKMFGLMPGAITPSVEYIFERLPESHQQQARDWYEKACKSLLNSETIHRIRLDNGDLRFFNHQIEPEVTGTGTVVRLLAIIQDITDRVRVERRIQQLEQYDAVTSLPNRKSFKDNAQVAIEQASKEGHCVGILNVGLNNLKQITDTFGSSVGDDLLKEAAQRVQDALRIDPTKKIVARVGGNELNVLLNRIKDIDDIETITNRIIYTLSKPFSVSDKMISATPSIGISVYPNDGEDAELLMNNAGIAMQESRSSADGSFRKHTDEMRERAVRRFDVGAKLRTALNNDEFSLEFQPQVHLESKKVCGAEALLRWNNAELGSVSPLEFISIAEDNGLIVPIGEWVLRAACKEYSSWKKHDVFIPRVAVNISTVQFVSSDLPSLVRSVLSEFGLEPSNLELEITESVFATDTEQAIKKLTHLSEMGIALSIDDFGTGYSSLSQLKEFPKNRLKIDRSFIKNVNDDSDDMAITKAVIGMAKSMNVSVLAEGVESLEQLNFLIRNECDEIQGFLISKPVPSATLIDEMEAVNRKIERLVPGELKRHAA